jgi:hypothetical protein
MLYSNKIDKNRLRLSLMDEILDIEDACLTIYSNRFEVFKTLDELQIPYEEKTIQEVLNFLFDRLLFEYMEDQSYYNLESYNKFKDTFIYKRLQLLITNTKSLMLWMSDNDTNQIPKNCKILYRKQDINPVNETNYLKLYERYKIFMEIATPERLVKYYNSLVGLRHFSVRTKAIYHAFVEELELRDIDYDILLYGKEKMLSYNVDIVTKNSKIKVIQSIIKSKN